MALQTIVAEINESMLGQFVRLIVVACLWSGGKTPLQNFLGIAEQHMGPNNGVSGKFIQSFIQ